MLKAWWGPWNNMPWDDGPWDNGPWGGGYYPGYYGGYPGYGPRLVCPASIYEEHQELEQILEENENITKRLKEIERLDPKEVNQEKISPLVQILTGEKEMLEVRIRTTQRLFDNYDNVEEKELTTEVIPYYPSSKYIPSNRIRT